MERDAGAEASFKAKLDAEAKAEAGTPVAAVTDHILPPAQFFTSPGGQVTMKSRPGWELHRSTDGKICMFDPEKGTYEFCQLNVKPDGSNAIIIGPPRATRIPSVSPLPARPQPPTVCAAHLAGPREKPIGGWAADANEDKGNWFNGPKPATYWGPLTCCVCLCTGCMCCPCLCCKPCDEK
jgi:hypothetical protein